MNKIIKTILIVLVSLIVFASLAMNVYSFGNQWLTKQLTNAYQTGIIDMRQAVYDGVGKGDIQISDKEGNNIITIGKK